MNTLFPYFNLNVLENHPYINFLLLFKDVFYYYEILMCTN